MDDAHFMKNFWLLPLSFLALNTQAQTNQIELPEISVYGIAKPSALDAVPTVSEVSGERLRRKRRSTVGETLANEVGVSSSQFGPNASRPVIRGLEGDRIRVLQNGTGVLDASAVSQDHAVSIDPLSVDRIEIVRGPAALLYGSNAIGGVVNLTTSRIPERPSAGAQGRALTEYATVDQGRSLGAGLTTPVAPRLMLHADGSARAADDYGAPAGRVLNSAARTGTEALGASYVFDKGFLGSSFSNYESTYGTVAERDVHINMLQQRWDVAGEWRPESAISSIRFKNTFSHYKHAEIERGETGTTFKNDGNEARLDIRHRPADWLDGIGGLQFNTFKFGARGEEAFLPVTNNQVFSAFLFEEYNRGALRPSVGARVDFTDVRSQTDDKFGEGRRENFTGTSASLGLTYSMSSKDNLVLNGAYSERAPNYEELFADGRHVATRQNERGLIALGVDPRKERAHSTELSWRHKEADSSGSVGVFVQDFKDFVTLAPTGASDNDADEPFEIFNYQTSDARFYGFEAEYDLTLPAFGLAGKTSLGLRLDGVRAINRSTGQDLPHIAPVREGITLSHLADHYAVSLEVLRAENQDRLAPGETRTQGYMLTNLSAELPVGIDRVAFTFAVGVRNLFNQEARNAVSVLKDIAPLPGRSFFVSAQAAF